MIHKIKKATLHLGILLTLAVPTLAMPSAMAADTSVQSNNINPALKCGSNLDLNSINASNGDLNCPASSRDVSGGPNLTGVVKKIINILSILVGAIAVIMIIFGGFRYVTSGGSDSSVSSAKNTILYAVIGLIIVALAQVIVHFVLNNIAT
jgi:hypothetical protein